MRKWSITDPADNFVALLTDSETFRRSVKYESGYIFARHDGKLLLEERFKIRQKDERTRIIVILDWYNLGEEMLEEDDEPEQDIVYYSSVRFDGQPKKKDPDYTFVFYYRARGVQYLFFCKP